MDILAGILNVTQMIMCGNKNRWGWMVGLGCSLSWISYVIITKSAYGLLIVCIPCVFINIRNFIKWSWESD